MHLKVAIALAWDSKSILKIKPSFSLPCCSLLTSATLHHAVQKSLKLSGWLEARALFKRFSKQISLPHCHTVLRIWHHVSFQQHLSTIRYVLEHISTKKKVTQSRLVKYLFQSSGHYNLYLLTSIYHHCLFWVNLLYHFDGVANVY